MFTALNDAVARLKWTVFHKLPTIRFQISAARKEAFRFVAPNLIQIGSGIIGPNASEEELLEQLLHVLVHAKNAFDGIKDQNINQYHNQEFRDTALDIGLAVVQTQRHGWDQTFSPLHPQFSKLREDTGKVCLPEPEAADHLKAVCTAIAFGPDFYKQVRATFNRQSERRSPKLTQLKYVCGCDPPHNSIRSGRRPDGKNALKAICENCGQKFVLAELSGE